MKQPVPFLLLGPFSVMCARMYIEPQRLKEFEANFKTPFETLTLRCQKQDRQRLVLRSFVS